MSGMASESLPPRDSYAGQPHIAAPRYFGGAGVKTSRLRPGSAFGLGFGAFLVSLRPLSLFAMAVSMTQKSSPEKCLLEHRSIRGQARGLRLNPRIDPSVPRFAAAISAICFFDGRQATLISINPS
jgi:hypothetical protein